jgi:peptide/nickel transport system ATP-binding protein
MSGAPLLEVVDLRTQFQTDDGVVRAVDGVSLTVSAGETVAVVGESGSGKSATALSIMGLLDAPAGRIVGGDVRLEGRSLVGLSEVEYRSLRGRELAMIFQDPMTSLNPVFRVGDQVAEALLVHDRSVTRRAARRRAVDLLDAVGISDPASRAREYPHQYSGGMRQRAMIAMAMANRPKLLIADEPTTALDVTVQAQVLEVLGRARAETGAAMLLITHDLGVVAGVADRVVVMYAGRVVEEGPLDDVFSRSRHPYTLGLLRSRPRFGADAARVLLQPIPGSPPSLVRPPSGCAFHPRCELAIDACRGGEPPPLRAVGGGPQRSACLRSDELAALMEPSR